MSCVVAARDRPQIQDRLPKIGEKLNEGLADRRLGGAIPNNAEYAFLWNMQLLRGRQDLIGGRGRFHAHGLEHVASAKEHLGGRVQRDRTLVPAVACAFPLGRMKIRAIDIAGLNEFVQRQENLLL